MDHGEDATGNFFLKLKLFLSVFLYCVDCLSLCLRSLSPPLVLFLFANRPCHGSHIVVFTICTVQSKELVSDTEQEGGRFLVGWGAHKRY